MPSMSESSRGRSPGKWQQRAKRSARPPERPRHLGIRGESDEGPYLTHVRYFHGQQTLVPPQNLGRVSKDRSKDRNRRADRRNESIADSPSHSTSRPVTPSGASVRSATSNRPISREQQVQTPPPAHIRSGAHSNQNTIPAEPPPTFEEAMRHDHISRFSPLLNCIHEPRECPRPPSVISLSSNDHSGDGSSLDPVQPSTKLSEWELDLRAGFSLEERVKREWERRHAETIPMPILTPEPVPLSVRHSLHASSATRISDSTPKVDADHESAEDSEWELIGPVAHFPLHCSARRPQDTTLRRPHRQPPTPPPPLPRSYVSVRDRIRQIEEGSGDIAQGSSNPIKRRRIPPPPPTFKPPRSRGRSSEHSVHPQCGTTPRSDRSLPEGGVITRVQICANTASINPTILKDFDPLHPTEGPSTSQAHESTTGSSEVIEVEGDSEEEGDMFGSSRPLPAPPINPPLTVITAFDELRQRRRAATVGSSLSPRLGRSPISRFSPDTSPSPRRQNRRHSTLSVANPSPDSPADEDISTAALLERNHQLNCLPVVNDEPEITQLDVLVNRLNFEDETVQGENYNTMLLLEEVMGNVTPLNPNLVLEHISVGKIEVQRRRITRDGRTKLKLSLLGITVDRCGICFSQFRENQSAAIMPNCSHTFHERCILDWFKRKPNCPQCRADVIPNS